MGTDGEKLAGKVALITGSGRGIGKALALKLARSGAAVVVNDIDADVASATVAEIGAQGGKAIACVGNVTSPDFADRFVQTGLDSFGGIDIIVSNAGYTRDAVIQKMSDDAFEAMIDVHLVAPFRILRAAAGPIRALAKQESHEGREVIRKVVLISSMSGTNGAAGQVNYASAKAGLVGMTKTMSKEWGRYKVCVNCVAFGFIETRLTKALDKTGSNIIIDGVAVQAGVASETLERLPALVPLGRAGTSEEAAGAVWLLCTPESDYVSGQVLIAAGGANL